MLARLECAPAWEHDDGIHRAVSRRHHRDGGRLVGHANARPSIVRRDAPRLRRDLSAPRQRCAEAVVLSAPMTRSLALTLNALGLCAIALVLAIAFAAQLLLDELPCPLCLLQRIQFAMLAVGRFSTSASGCGPATMPSRFSPPSPARPSPRGRSCYTSCPETPAMARRCSATIITAGRLSALPLPALRSRPCCCSTDSSGTTASRSPPARSCAPRCGW